LEWREPIIRHLPQVKRNFENRVPKRGGRRVGAVEPIEEPSQEPSDKVAKFDQYWKYENGLDVSITSAGKATTSTEADGSGHRQDQEQDRRNRGRR
jgi:hypothetical protein